MDRHDLTNGAALASTGLAAPAPDGNTLEQQGLPIAHLPAALRLRGTLDQGALEQSFSALVQRHQVLRASIAARDGQPLQVGSPSGGVRLPVLDVSGQGTEDRESTVRHLISQEARRPFDLAHGPLLRATLLRLAAQEHVLLVTLHRLAADEESLGIIFSELGHLYSAFSQGARPQLLEPSIQYADYARWRREWLRGAEAAEHLAYWREQLREAPAVLDLPTDHPRPASPTCEAARQAFLVPRPVVEALEQLSQQEGATLFTALLAALNALLSRYTRQTDILVGIPSDGRLPELKHLVGPFAATLALRTRLADNPPFRQVLRQVQEATQEAYAHQSLSFEHLVELEQQHQHGSVPHVAVRFALRDAPPAAPRLPGVQAEWLEVQTGAAPFDLSLTCTQTEAGVQAVLEYHTQLFEATTIARMAGHFQTLLAGIAANPAQRLSALPLLTAAERQQLLIEWNSAQIPYPPVTLHQLVEARAAQDPQAIALACGEEQLTYDELNRRANQVARVLQELGVGPETTVGLLLERTPDLVVGLLGILKAGGAYVPLDPAYPQERLAFTLQNARAPVLLTQQRLLSCLPEQARQARALVCLDVEQARIAAQPQENLENRASPANLAYIIYTSGSTGQPKGVAITHQSAVILVYWAKALFPAEDLAGVLASTSVCFDLSIFELFVPLTWGGKVILAEHALQLPEIAQRESVTLVNTVPSAMAELVRGGGVPASVRTVNLAGEALPRHLVDQIYTSTAAQRVFNLYGPTEDTTYSTWALLEREPGSPVTIGRPLPNTTAYLLDDAMQPVPVGVPGELYLGGKGLARGYFQRPDLTAERFVPDPFSPIPGARLYRTGDLARYRPDGRLDYLGRIDHQVKVRGFRIEPGEVEAALMRHASVRQCLVLAREDRPGEKRLVAYLVPADAEERPTAMHLRRHVQQFLPEYMMPAAFVWLNEMPLTANGKIDRKALPMPARSRPEQEEAFVAPATPLERRIAAAWAEVLDLDAVGVLDNFFALGGDSIRSLRVIALLKQQGLSCSLTHLFHHQTVRELAQTLAQEGLQEAPAEPAAPSSQPFALVQPADLPRLPTDLDDAYPATQLQLGMLFHSTYEPDSSIYHNVISLHLRAPFNQHHLEQALHVVAARHPVLRTSFDLNSYSEPLQLVHRVAQMPLGVADLRHLPPEEQEQRIQAWFEAEQRRRFTWTQAPLARFQVHRRTDETFQFTLTDHHAILDGWSEAALLTEVLGLYSALQHGQEPPDEAPSAAHLRDYVQIERSTIASEAARRYWQEKLADATIMKLPRLGPRRPASGAEPRECATLIPEDVVQGLKQLARRANVPLKSVLLAAHLRVMSLLSGEADVLTGVASDGRLESADGERVLGLFLNTVPFRQTLAGGSWISLAQGTFKNELEFLPFRRYPLAQIQQEHGGQPLFETLFNYTHFHVYQRLYDLPLQVLGTQEYAETNFALLATFNLDAATSDLHLVLQYKPAEFSAEQMRTIAGYYLAALQRMAHTPTERYEAQGLLSPAEQHQLLREWNNTAANYPHTSCIHQVFEQQASQTPDAVAVVFKDQALTYQALNIRANQLAHHLQQLGVGPEVCVGLCLERSLELVIALLAILKAGGAYVPLDPQYPQERLAFMLANARVPVLLTQTHLQAHLPRADFNVLCLDRDWPQIAEQPEHDVSNHARPENLAYVMYTSGSTGQPKGVCISHQAVLRLVKDATYARFGADEVFLQFAAISFDAATFEIWGALLNGARLVVPAPAVLDLEELGKTLQRYHVTTLWLTAGLFHLMVQEQLESLGQVRQLLAGGDVLAVAQVRQVLQRHPSCQLINGYGPTESTTFACCHLVTNPGQLGESVPIGKPITNTQVYVLDRQFQPVPVGVPGELYIGGVGLARGYLHRPELTAERFIPHPFSAEPGARLYKTGDLVRYSPEGIIEFLGRRDHQIKIRGFRVELGEIETRLGEHPGVKEVVVVAREEQPGEKRIVSYVVPREQPGPSRQELRGFLRERFPEYMVPAAFVLLERLPLNPNGKVDARALPAAEAAISDLADTYRAPRTPTEEALAAIWAELFHVQRVGVDDNFFELGGHSLLAMQAITRVRAALGVNPPLRVLFEAPTIAAFAQALATQEAAPQQSARPARVPRRITKMSEEEIRAMLPQKRREQD